MTTTPSDPTEHTDDSDRPAEDEHGVDEAARTDVDQAEVPGPSKEMPGQMPESADREIGA